MCLRRGQQLYLRLTEAYSFLGGSQSQVLVTRTSDGVSRVWAPVIDEPNKLRLWAAVDPSSFGEEDDELLDRADQKSAIQSARVVPGSRAAFYLDAAEVTSAIRANIAALERDLQMAALGVGDTDAKPSANLEKELEMKQTRVRRLEHISSETPDLFMRIQRDGSVVVKAVAVSLGHMHCRVETTRSSLKLDAF